MDQVVFLLSSSQWKDVENVLEPRVGKEYILVTERKDKEKKAQEVDQTIINGEKYENVRYFQERESTKIEEVASYVD